MAEVLLILYWPGKVTWLRLILTGQVVYAFTGKAKEYLEVVIILTTTSPESTILHDVIRDVLKIKLDYINLLLKKNFNAIQFNAVPGILQEL